MVPRPSWMTESPAMSITVVLVVPDDCRRQALVHLLRTASGICLSAAVATVVSATSLPARTPAAVVLLDAQELERNGLEPIAQLHDHFPLARVVVLGPEHASGLALAVLGAGADGYLFREIAPAGLVRALQALERGEVALPRPLVGALLAAVRAQAPRPFVGAATQLFTGRERAVLAELAQGCSNAEIARRLQMGETTVKTHVSHILRKTGARSRVLLQAEPELTAGRSTDA